MKTKLILLVLILLSFNVFALGAVITPSNPDNNDNLLCYLDVAEDQTLLNFRWYRNSALVSDPRIYTDDEGSHYPRELTTDGDTIGCEVSDLLITGFTDYTSVIIGDVTGDNLAPVAVAGDDVSIPHENYLTFDGSESYDTDGEIVEYHWFIHEGLADTLPIAHGHGIRFTYYFPEAGDYVVLLAVEDNDGDTESASLRVHVNGRDDGTGENIGYDIRNLQVYSNNGFTHEDSSFLRGDTVYAKFEVVDKRTGRAVENAYDILQVTLKDLDTEEVLEFTPYTGRFSGFLGNFLNLKDGSLCLGVSGLCSLKLDGTYYYTIETPLSDDHLGNQMIKVAFETGNPDIARKKITLNNNIPEAVASADPATALPEQSVRFSGLLSSDVEDSRLDYTWNFGDGHSGTGGIVSHIYPEPGTYIVTLEVTDSDGGRSTDTLTILVDPETDDYDRLGDVYLPDDEYDYDRPGDGFLDNEDGDRNGELNFPDEDSDYDRIGDAYLDDDDNSASFSAFSVSSISVVNLKPTYRAGDNIELFVNVKNDGSENELLTVTTHIVGVNSFDVQNVRINAGSNTIRPVNLNIPNNLQKGSYLVKVILDNKNGEINSKSWQFNIA